MMISDRDLLQLATALLGAGSGAEVIAVLERWLGTDEALYLVDQDAGVAYPVCGAEEEVALAQIVNGLPDGWSEIVGGDERLGYWVSSLGDAAAIAQLLGPLLLRLREREMLSADLRRSKRELREIITAGQLLRHLDVEVLLVRALETMLSSLEAEVGAILAPVEHDGVPSSGSEGGDVDAPLEVRTTWGIQSEHVEQIRLFDGQRAVDMCYHEACHLRLAPDELPKLIDTAQLQVGLTSLLILPLVSSGRKHGVLLLANPQHTFDEEAQRLAETLCDMVIIALDNARLVAATLAKERLARDMHLARTVQSDMLPKDDLETELMVVAGVSEPCDETGGDYFGYRQNEAGRIQCFLGDVTGHGLGAALFTTIAHAIAQQGFRRDLSPDAAIIQLNESLYATGSGRFMTGVVLEADPETGQVTYCSAGHNPMLHLSNSEPVWLASQTLPLGICEDLTSLGLDGSVQTSLASGDWLILYTDGFIEAADDSGELWGEERFAAVFEDARATGSEPSEAISNVLSAVRAYAGDVPIDDDLTLVVIVKK